MDLQTQYKMKSDPNLLRFLRENSLWYKYLNRSNNAFASFYQNYKNEYQLNPSDRFQKMLDNIMMMQNFLNMLK